MISDATPRSTSSILNFLLLVGMLVLGSACGEPEPAPVSADVKYHDGGKGRIVELVADGTMAVVRHDEIPGFMMGMTMTFGLREDSVRSAVQAGDSIHFEVAFDGIDSWISRVQVITEE